MKNFFEYIAPFAPDYSGAAAVFYGAKGMVVLCDPGGCSGNVCGYDEPRFYKERGMIFSAALRDMDTIFGRDKELVDKILRAAKGRDIPFIALVGTPVTSVIATDLNALCPLVEKKTGIRTVSVDTNGMELYDKGERKAKKVIEKYLPELYEGLKPTPLDSIPTEEELECLAELVKKEFNDIRAESLSERCACIKVETKLNDPPHTEHKVEERLRESAECGESAGVSNISRSGYHLLTNTSFNKTPEEPALLSSEKPGFIPSGQNILIVHSQECGNMLREKLTERGFDNVTVGTWFFLDPKKAMAGDIQFKDEEEFINTVLKYDCFIGDPLFNDALRNYTGKKLSFPHRAVSGDLYG